MKPKARLENIIVQEVETETLICDLTENRVFCLNSTAGEVWKLCDGKTNIWQIADKLSRRTNSLANEELVLLTLRELSSKRLLSQKIETSQLFGNLSRRDVVKKIGLTSMIALPIITSVLMPQAVNAQSASLVNGQSCSSNSQCLSSFCADSVCCSGACNGICERCNSAGTLGSCAAVPSGQDPDIECPSGVGLMGTCNGARACF